MKASSIRLRVQAILQRLPEKLDRFLPALRRFRPARSDCAVLMHCLYQTALGRLADDQALARGTARLRAGGSITLLTAHLVRSEEFRKRHGATVQVRRELIDRLYRDALGRWPDPEGLRYWLDAAARGVDLSAVVAGLAISEECVARYRRQLIESLYRTALGRFIDESALTHALTSLQNGISLDQFATRIANSAEFEALHGKGARISDAYLVSLYRNGLGRMPNSEELRAWNKPLTRLDRRGALLAMATSHESLTVARQQQVFFVHAILKAAFGQVLDSRLLPEYIRRLESGASADSLVKQLCRSADFKTRHPGPEAVDFRFLNQVYWDSFERLPNSMELAQWLSDPGHRATQGQVITAFAQSEEMKRQFTAQAWIKEVPFAEWIARYDDLSDLDRSAIRLHIRSLTECPLISAPYVHGW